MPALTTPRHLLAATLALALALLAFPSASLASDGIYWSSYRAGGPIRLGNLSGPGSQDLIAAQNTPDGVAIDAAGGRIFWADYGSNSVRVASLDGTGAHVLFAGETQASGLAIDPGAGKLYWTTSTAVRVGNLDGTGAKTLFASESLPLGIALDPAAGKIYWGSYSGFTIRVGNLDGTGVATTLFPGENYPTGLVIDPAAGKLYWTNETAGTIRVGNVNGSGTPANLFTGEGSVGGLAIDPGAGKLYWASYGLSSVRVGNLDGTGATNLFTGENQPWFVAILRAPAAAGAPSLVGSGAAGLPLSCGTGTWAPDLVGGFVYRAPASVAYQWLKDGAEISGATTTVYTPFAPGSYSCRVTATNHAGSTAQTSAAVVTAPLAGSGGGGGGGGGTTPPPPGLKQLKLGYNAFFAYSAGRNRATKFLLSHIPRGAKLEVRCHGKGCTFTRKTVKVKGTTANIVSTVRRVRLARRSYFELRTSAAGYVTEVLRFVAAGPTGATVQRLCLPAGAKKPGKCTR
jgi:DNA-binding beta-propeller fold protein YncE